MNRNLILGVLVAAVAFGCATAQKPVADSAAAGNTVKTAAADPHCVRDSGSRIQRPEDKDKPCGNVPGSSYSQRELEDTGRIDTAEALKELDPRVH